MPICPYCGSINTDSNVYLDDDEMAEIADDLGCMAISYHMEHTVETGFLYNTGFRLPEVANNVG